MAKISNREYVESGIYRRPGWGNYILVLKLSGRQYTEALPAGVTLRTARELTAKLRGEARRRTLLAAWRPRCHFPECLIQRFQKH